MTSPTACRIVLVVEDEPSFRFILSQYLESEGYRVLQAGCADQAFRILASQPQLDLLITDFRLPDGVTGVMIAEPALKLRPELKILYMSGHPTELFDSGTPTLALAPILVKPFSLEGLGRQLRALLP